MSRSTRSSRRILGIAVTAVAASALVLAPMSAANAGPPDRGGHPGKGCDARNNNSVSKLLECVTKGGVLEHLDAFQAIADEHDGTRAAGLPGYDASVDYVAERLERAGWEVSFDEFPYDYFGPSTLRQLTPTETEHETGAFTGSASAEVTGTIVPVDINLDVPADATSGCEPEDFTGLDFSGPSDIALIQRGVCDFSVKVTNATAVGAEAVIIFNQGNDPTREGLIVGTLDPLQATVPVVGASFAAGAALAVEGSTALISVPEPESRPQRNVIAELPGRNDDNVVMAGAHLDSVQAGPGINDNGSGSAALLEIAENLGKWKPQNTVRFAWWGAEEDGLLGSEAYVTELDQAARDRIALYLNFDMVASPNYISMVYDSDQSTFPAGEIPIPEGSVAIEDLFESYYTALRQPYDDTAFDGRSDYEAFILAGIPAGGLFTGAEEVKTEEQAAIWGGTAGEQFDPCYHLACDTRANINEQALYLNVGAIATAVLTYGQSTESVNGVRGAKWTIADLLPEPAGPQGTFPEGGGGLAHDHGNREAA
ncbi:M28 family metallopeptidase [Agromyces aerolatus]|uniref:M28 family metallopeptidase n=1 Tax=Agromyces sp. LY-1074 TaxID=3074080 RepID=UPI0028626D01|nr:MULTISPECIES: M28 family metallopeptidase [unclassified Agromyces]MDR5701063.1 M28 family metallopeptidase [Agromyces sp. LY-1074]MDR5707703.1 M28 family metallopeptidase [Agromyces sp. LY-1358]